MRSLTLLEQGLVVSLEGELLDVTREGERIDRIRLGEIDEVLVFGSIQLTPAVVNELLRRSVEVLFFTARGSYRGRLVGRPGKNLPLRLAQFAALTRTETALDVARGMIGGKLANQRNLLLRAQREQRREELADAIGGLRLLLAELPYVADHEALRGFEGRAAALYFEALPRCLKNPAFTMRGRSRRPPRDPPNAILSFGYTLLAGVAESALLRVGLDPYLGALHASRYGQPSLVLDLIEEFRPLVVDSLMLRIVNRREVTPEDFEEPLTDEEPDLWADPREDASPAVARAVWLSDTGRRVFFRAWGRRLRETMHYPPRGQALAVEEILRQQAYHLARVLRGEERAYQAFVPR